MKNIIKIGSILSVTILTNCSSNDNLDNALPLTTNTKVLSKITTTYYDNPSAPQISTGELFYENGRLHKAKTLEDNRYSVFEYDTNGKVIRQVHYKSDNTIEYNSIYTYNGDELINVKSEI